MPEEQDQQSPEILKQIQAAERNVERMVRAAEQEAASALEKARAQAKALVEGKREALETRKKARIAEGVREAEREGEWIVQEAQVKATGLKAHGTARLDDAVKIVLERVLPAEPSAISRKTPC
jgi:vacuolar-type H+-ATPase subunit H